MEVTSNVDELVKHLNFVFQGMFDSDEIEQSGRNVYDILYSSVSARLRDTGYDYHQSGDFLEMMEDEKKGFQKDNKSKQSITVGFGSLDQLNDPNYMRQEQTGLFFNGRYDSNGRPMGTPMHLKAETQMPKWVVLEFGTGDGAVKLPSQFNINYTRRPDKDIMYGPSMSAPSGLSKPIFAMLSGEQVAKFRGEDKPTYDKRHKGVRAGRFFQNGLDDAKPQIAVEFGKGIRNYLKSMGG